MLNYLWSFLVILSIVVAIFTGRLPETINGGMSGATEGVEMCLNLLGVMCMWNGIMKIAEHGGITEKISVAMKPLFKMLFRNISVKSEAGKNIMLNMTANFLGMGNAATPAGLKAMKAMKKLPGAKGDMTVFTVLNTASFQLLPSTLIAMRATAGSANPSEIILPVWCASACSVTVALLCAKTVSKL